MVASMLVLWAGMVCCVLIGLDALLDDSPLIGIILLCLAVGSGCLAFDLLAYGF